MFLKSKKQAAMDTQMSVSQRNLLGEKKLAANKAADCFGSALLTTWQLFGSVLSLRL